MTFGVAAVLIVVAGSSTGRTQTAALPADQRITLSAVKVTEGQDPHAYGIKLDLWKRAGAWVGFISEYTGFVADPPAGRLDGLQIDEAAGKIVFTAKLSLGMTTAKGTSEWVRTKDVYEFTGTIDKDTIVACSPSDRPTTHRAGPRRKASRSSGNRVTAPTTRLTTSGSRHGP